MRRGPVLFRGSTEETSLRHLDLEKEKKKGKKMKVNARMDQESQSYDDEEIPGSGQGMYGYILTQALVGEQLSAIGFQQRGP